MIIPNLMVTDMSRALSFYRDLLGLEVTMTVDANRNTSTDGSTSGAVFAILAWEGDQLMLQTAGSLADDLPGVLASEPPSKPAATVYLRGFHPDRVQGRVPQGTIVKGPERAWYGMLELFLRDPDGHIICLGVPDGPPPE